MILDAMFSVDLVMTTTQHNMFQQISIILNNICLSYNTKFSMISSDIAAFEGKFCTIKHMCALTNLLKTCRDLGIKQ